MNEMLGLKAQQARQSSALGSVLSADDYLQHVRWQPGERLQHLFEERANRFDREGPAQHPALDIDGVQITFLELDRRANQMARYLGAQGLGGGDRIGLILDRSPEAYVALLAVLKIGAAYVPLDIKFPSERIAFIAGDAGIKAFVATAAGCRLIGDAGLPVIELSVAAEACATEPVTALEIARSPACDDGADDQLCYIIYTSGSTGRPKGVAVNHSSICNFVRVAAEAYGYMPSDRVYQGMTLAFDFSVEELWVPLLSGATLVPSPADRQMVGDELAHFLKEKRVTAMCCVPTLLATISDDLPELRLLLVSGEACPQDIVARWHRPGRRMLNAYGPTEATVTATWTEVHPNKPVTIGAPLPTYTIAILETVRDELVGAGNVGEIAIGGIGLAVGYVNRDGLTRRTFVPDFLRLANNPSRRLYRTGDLGRINEDGEVEYLGRIDTQVKIRGYRIELAEIENVLLEVEGVAQAVVTTYEAEPGLVELAAYYTCFDDGAKPGRDRLLRVLRSRLPGYMVPAYLEMLEVMPLLASHKADRKALPAPSSMRLVSNSGDFVAPRSETERRVAECLARILNIEAVSVEDHFFDDLGAHSLLMAQFVAELNREMPSAGAAISDVYLAPSIARLAGEIDGRAGAHVHDSVVEPAYEASDFDYWRCGLLQFGFYVSRYAFAVAFVYFGAWWCAEADGTLLSVAERALVFSMASLALLMAMPIAAKWLLIGRWHGERIPLWSVRYFRFWAVRELITTSPWLLFRGTVLFNVYLRLLGARIGHGAMIMTRSVPLATDLLEIGEYTVVRKGVHLTGYRAENGYIAVGGIDIGKRVTVGEAAAIDIETSIGDGAQLGHASALLDGQSIPAGARYHGSPAVETATDFRYFVNEPSSLVRRCVFAGVVLALLVVVTALPFLSLVYWPSASGGSDIAVSISGSGFAGVFWLSMALFWGILGVSLVVHLTVPRLLRALLVAGRSYPLYGFHYFVAQAAALLGHLPGFQILLGDSSAIAHYFRWLGMKQPDLKQTGSNFGTATAYESAGDVEIGSGSMVSDGLTVVNLAVGSASFRLMPARIGSSSFVGNSIVYPPNARLGDNCLMGSKVMLPVDGKLRENVGLLGSPAFEIPREVVNPQRFSPVPETAAEKARLRAKNAFNLRTGLIYLVLNWLLVFGLMIIGYIASVLYAADSVMAIVGAAVAAPVWAIVHALISERLSLIGLHLKAHNCTIHEPYYWRIERHWKLGMTLLKNAFRGTPFRPMLLRLLGLKVGRKVFEDGSGIAEKGLVEIGDGCCINAHVSLQGHSLEDGLYKSDHIRIGRNCTIGPMAFVHYGVTIGDNAILDTDAFVMKGAVCEARSRWQGNPARQI